MANDQENQYEGHEDSEYHFSDEEVSYEVENEEPKKATPTSGASPVNLLARLTQSKRMIISGGVFLLLVLVAYKMVAPTSTVPATDINTAPVVADTKTSMPAQAPSNVQQAQVAAVTPASSVSAPAQAVPEVTATQAPAVQPVAAASQAASPAAVMQQVIPAIAAQATGTMMPSQSTTANMTAPAAIAQQVQQVATAAMQQQQAAVATTAQQPPMLPGQQMQAAVPTAAGYQPVESMQAPVNPYASTQPTAVPADATDARVASMTATNDQMMAQIQNQTNQQITEYANRNKALQDQVETLSSRVNTLETQLSQLVQALTRRNQANSGATTSPQQQPSAPSAEAVVPQPAETRVAYNVQAIIPGRAWLKSDNGETLTVAEGDMVRDLGRVSKIDPYDGVVEINTGSKSISLSYGNSG